MATIGSLKVLLGIDTSGFTSGLGAAGRTAGESAGIFGGLGKTIAGTAAGFITATAVMGGIRSAFSFASHAAIDMNASLEKSTLQFGTLMGDTQRAEKHVRDLFEFAKKTPFETGPVIEASRRMQTFGGDALNTMDNLTLLGDAAAATGAPIEDLGFWVGRMFAGLKGGQPIGEATMRLMELGVLTPQVREQMEGLAKSAGGGEKAFNLFKESLGGFSGAMVAQANTWDGLMSSISDAINLTLADALRPFFDTVKVGAQVVLQALGSDGAQKVFAGLKEKMTGVFGGDGQALVKSLGNSMLTFSSVALTVADIVGRGFDGLKVVFSGLAAGVLAIFGALTENVDRLVTAYSKVPLLGDKFKGIQSAAHDLNLQVQGMRQSFDDQAKAAMEGVKGNSTWSTTIAAGKTAIEGMRGVLMSTVIATNASTEATKRQGDARADVTVKTKEQIKAEQELQRAQEKFAGSVTRLDTAEWFVPFKAGVQEATQELEPLAANTDIATRGMMRYRDTVVAVGTIAKREFTAIGDAVKNMGVNILQAIQGGGSIIGSIGASLGSGLGTDFVKNFGTKITGALGTTLGGAFNAVLPGIGALMGPALEKLGAGFKKLFGIGINEEVRKANAEIDKLRKSLIDTHGPLDVIEAKFRAVGLSAMENWAHQGKAGQVAFTALIAEFNKRWAELEAKREQLESELADTRGEFDSLIGKANELGYEFDKNGQFIGASFDSVKAKADEFGVSVDGLGGKFRQLGIDQEAKRIIDGFELMAKAGGDVGGILVGMKDEIGKLVADSIKLGTTIPSNMQPWIEELIRTGQLVDENGVAITDLSKIKFADPIKTEYEKISTALLDVVNKIDELISRIAAIPTSATFTVRKTYEDPGPPAGFYDGGGSDSRGDEGFASGTLGRLGKWFGEFPKAGFATALHGIEAVVTPQQAPQFAMDVLSGMGGSSTAPAGGDMSGMVAAIERLERTLVMTIPTLVESASRHGSQTSGRRR